MNVLAEISVVVGSLALVAIAVACVRVMYCVGRATDQFTRLTGELQRWIVQATEFTREARETVASAREAIAPIRAVADRFEILGERTANLSAAVLGEIEGPVHTAVAVARGLRSVTAYFLERLSHRATPGRPTTNGGPDRE